MSAKKRRIASSPTGHAAAAAALADRVAEVSRREEQVQNDRAALAARAAEVEAEKTRLAVLWGKVAAKVRKDGAALAAREAEVEAGETRLAEVARREEQVQNDRAALAAREGNIASREYRESLEEDELCRRAAHACRIIAEANVM